MNTQVNEYGVRLAFVLDDEARLGLALCKMLGTIGIEARQFVDHDSFLGQLDPCNPDLVFLDLALGESDAIDIIHQLERRKFQGRVMLISGRDMETLLEVEQVGKAHGLHMLPSLPKPFRMADVKECLLPSPALQPDLEDDDLFEPLQKIGLTLRSKA
ncbi:MAG TPA: response regulator [Xanthobacteraceae bacterium]|nr:response regulator [Xanthobacteraceae bacterium]